MGLKVKLGTRVFPWEDLLTPDFASPFLTLGDGEDIEFVLAVMAGMGPTVPKMVRLDATGAQITSLTNPGAVEIVNADAINGAGVLNMGGGLTVVSGNHGLITAGAVLGFDGSGGYQPLWRGRGANYASKSAAGALFSTPPGMWSVVSTPAAGVQASASIAAGAAGVIHVCTGIVVTFGAIAAPVATAGSWVLRDGATGAGTILASGQVPVPAAVFIGPPVVLSDITIPGTAATAMTLEFTAGLANLLQGCTLIGFDAS